VFFRAQTQKAATGYNLTGWVRNLADGRVEALLEGESKSVDKMLEWCRKGPPAARVENISVTEELYTCEFNNFTIKY